MQEALNAIVATMFSLDFRDDDFRNASEAGKSAGLRYYFKRKNSDSDWEVYATWNQASGLLSLHYYNLYTDKEPYPVFYIAIEDEHDAAAAIDMLKKKTDYLWVGANKDKKTTADSVSSAVRRMGFLSKGTTNNITTWVKGEGNDIQTLLVENGVSLSIYLFSGDPKGRARPILSLRSIHEDGCWSSAHEYLKRKSRLVPSV